MSPRVGLTTERVVRAAAELADEIGFQKLTLSALARHFGVKDPSLYVHVRNLHDLRVRVALLAGAELNDRIGSAVAGRSGKDALVAFADAYRSYALDYPERYASTQIRMDPAEVADEPALLRGIELTSAILRGYHLGEPETLDAARLLRSTFHGFATLESTGAFAHSRSPHASWPHIIDALHLTLSNWPTYSE
ncbi:TetR/AcrR family transcriptional regulator [Nocardia seriolae]|uniref:Transcriptional regulator n=1 Tax=Nocardia seriolae TaxID=37332 RepID=A0A0B8NJL6_9NOCA|nr:TetR-like C-terminal domain-containing protein [Nocardia seriolae]APA97854.1 putative HTH-type transcriptional regulator YobS [Nocardia seriolae]MTJ64396.1 TetR family transcriptional regulator [Nocardia seriolae]MTJ75352.1 TetR family transcriptional regulator [Nocardia seriolae]MTJ87610.1 TetR family transcriptional regulator [Nocardia seriolae]MTK42261.1 TetR family transcriptional regulator [Nocardia seriolae]